MKKSPVFLTLLLSAFFISAYGQDGWKSYNYPDKYFKINFFQQPSISADTTFLQDTPIVTYNWEINVDDTLHENKYYGLSFTKYPSDYICSDSLLSVVEGFINSSQNELLEDKEFVLLSSSLVEKDGYPGKIFKWKNINTNMFLEFRVFLVNSSLYQLSVVSREDQNHNKFINNYFNSFNLINTTKGSFILPDDSVEQKYLIDFPSKPTTQNKFIDSEYGKLTINIQTLETDETSDNLVYVLLQTKYPTRVVNQDNIYELNKFYKKCIDNSLQSVNGELISINDVFYNNILGKEYKCYFSKGEFLMVYRVFYIDEFLYSLGVITYPNKDNNKKMSDFFNSFRIIK
jgi:hypothetical protein